MIDAIRGSVCMVCGESSGYRRVLKSLDRCQTCGFVAYRDATEVDLAAIYDDAYFAGEEYPDYLGQQHALRRSMRRHLAQMWRYGPARGGLLEIGCAYGLFLDEARPFFRTAVGVDICRTPIAYARAELGLDARLGDFLTMDFGTERFDVICLWDTIEHLPAPAAFLDKAARVLNKSGMMFLTTGDMGSLNARLRGASWRQIHPPTHLQYFSRSTIRRLLERLGFDVVGIETTGYYHTAYNILASIRLRRGLGRPVASAIMRVTGERLLRRMGVWLNFGDIMFVAARRRASA